MALDTFNPYLFVSSGEQSNKFLTPVISPEGIASFQAQRAQQLTKLLVQIDPVQSGSGTPSPDNMRPISGRTGMTVTVSGSNLLNIQPQSGTVSGVSYVVDSDGYITLNGTAGAGCNIYLQTHIAPFNSKVTISSSVAMPTNVYAGLTQQNGNRGLLELRPGDTTRTSDDSGISEESRFRIYAVPGVTFTNYKCRIMLNYGASALPYEPYTAQTYPISWQTEAGTVYGGTLDVVSGVLTVTDAQIASYAGETLPGEWISDRDVYAAGTTPTTGAQVVYKLATPQTYQLTPTEVRTIAGYNQIYSDAGPVIDIKF